MKPFRFQIFTVNQSKNVFRVGTDAVLLGSLCNLDNAQKILEVGTGCGVISLMIAQRNSEAEILAIDINSEATDSIYDEIIKKGNYSVYSPQKSDFTLAWNATHLVLYQI